MELRLVKTLWGVDDAAHPERWPALFARIKAEGFAAIECPFITWMQDEAAFTAARKAAGLDLVVQVHTTAKVDATGFHYMTSRALDDHTASLDAMVDDAVRMGACHVNAHSGCDCWDVPTVHAYLRHALATEARAGITISHETHRRRLFYSPFAFRDCFMGATDTAGLEGVKVTADLSHWACVCERVFGNAACTDANGSDDEWWLPTLAEVGRRCALVHARVGFAEGPQVPDPSAPEYAGEVEAHMSWWAAIWNARAAAGDAVVLAEPEHGPAPYMWSLPHTRAPVADLWEVNSWVARQLKERFAMEELYEARARAASRAGARAGEPGAPAAAERALSGSEIPRRKKRMRRLKRKRRKMRQRSK
eukprot:PRCOL_00001391-RA